jgi:hypothetical protein
VSAVPKIVIHQPQWSLLDNCSIVLHLVLDLPPQTAAPSRRGTGSCVWRCTPTSPPTPWLAAHLHPSPQWVVGWLVMDGVPQYLHKQYIRFVCDLVQPWLHAAVFRCCRFHSVGLWGAQLANRLVGPSLVYLICLLSLLSFIAVRILIRILILILIRNAYSYSACPLPVAHPLHTGHARRPASLQGGQQVQEGWWHCGGQYWSVV